MSAYPYSIGSVSPMLDDMTLFRSPRRATSRPAPARRVIVAASNHWKVTDAGYRRGITVREPSGALSTVYVPEDHPALVAFLADAAAVAA